MSHQTISFSTGGLGPEVESSVRQVIRADIVAQGPMVGLVEDEFAAMIDVEHATAVSNGTTTLVAAVQARSLVGRATRVANGGAVSLAGVTRQPRP